MVKTVTGAGRPEVAAGAEAVYRALFDSFSPDQNGRISPLEVLSRLERAAPASPPLLMPSGPVPGPGPASRPGHHPRPAGADRPSGPAPGSS